MIKFCHNSSKTLETPFTAPSTTSWFAKRERFHILLAYRTNSSQEILWPPWSPSKCIRGWSQEGLSQKVSAFFVKVPFDWRLLSLEPSDCILTKAAIQSCSRRWRMRWLPLPFVYYSYILTQLLGTKFCLTQTREVYMMLGGRQVYLSKAEWAEWIHRWVPKYLRHFFVAEHHPIHSGSLQPIIWRWGWVLWWRWGRSSTGPSSDEGSGPSGTRHPWRPL